MQPHRSLPNSSRSAELRLEHERHARPDYKPHQKCEPALSVFRGAPGFVSSASFCLRASSPQDCLDASLLSERTSAFGACSSTRKPPESLTGPPAYLLRLRYWHKADVYIGRFFWESKTFDRSSSFQASRTLGTCSARTEGRNTARRPKAGRNEQIRYTNSMLVRSAT